MPVRCSAAPSWNDVSPPSPMGLAAAYIRTEMCLRFRYRSGHRALVANPPALRGYAAHVSESTDVPATGRSDSHDLARRSAALVDDSLYASARGEADELGAASPDALTAEAIRLIARLNGARAAVCITPAPGVPALAILAAAGPDSGAVVTCITEDPHHLDAARTALRGAGHTSASARYIAARPLEVADKLADGAYDLVVADVPDHSVARVVSRSHQLLRDGGALVLIGEHAPLPEDANLPEHAHVTVLPVGTGLTVVTL